MNNKIMLDFGKNGGVKTVKRSDCFTMGKLLDHYKANNTSPSLIRSLVKSGDICPIDGLTDKSGKELLAFWLTKNAKNLIHIK